MKKFVSMFMVLVMAFTMGPVVVARAEEDKAAKAEKTVLEAIDLVERCVDHPKLCAYGISFFAKTLLDEKIQPGIESVFEFIKNWNYAPLFSNSLANVIGEALSDYPELEKMRKLAKEDNVSFSQVCDALRSAVEPVQGNHSGGKNTKEEL